MNRNPILPALAAALLCACAGVLESDRPARHVYLLEPPEAVPGPAPAAPPAALILSVQAIPGLDTDRVLVLGTDARLNPVANARWADFLPEVFASLARRTLADTGQFGPVREGEIARPDEWLLRLELQAFYGIQDGSGATRSVRLDLEGQLQCNDAEHVIRVSETAPAGADSLAQLTAAHQSVVNAALKQLPGRVTAACSPS